MARGGRAVLRPGHGPGHREDPHRLGDPRRGRRDPARPAGRRAAGPADHLRLRRQPVRARSTWATCASSSPCTSSPRRSAAAASPVRHLHSWDDYDRFRKVPAGVDPAWAEHIGRPLSAVPDPWECHDSWAEHFKAPLQAALAEMGVEMEEVSQTEQYRAGAYREQVLTAVAPPRRHRGGAGAHRTKKAAPVAESEQEAAALADSVADEDDEGPSRRPATSPASPTSPTAASAAATRPRSRRTTTRRPTCPTPAPRAASPASPTWPPSTRASWCGRSTGRCAGRSRASTSSRAASTTPPRARRTPSARSW